MADRKGLSYTSSAEAQPNPQMFGLYLGIVTHTRTQDLWVQVNIPQILGPQDSNWARPIGFNGVGTAASGFGGFTITAAGPGGTTTTTTTTTTSSDSTASTQGQPAGWCVNEVGPGPPVGSLVVVLFLGGDRNRPGYLLTSQSVSGAAIAPVAAPAPAGSSSSAGTVSSSSSSSSGSSSSSSSSSSGSGGSTGGSSGGGTGGGSGDAMPNGPSGSWTLTFEDLFPGTSLNSSNWTALQGASINNGTTESSAVTVSGNQCHIGLNGTINSNPSNDDYGSGADGPTLNVGDCVEASINFPGPSGDTAYNWPAFWAAGGNWPAAGEEDIFESYNGTPSALNYHSPAGANNGPFPSGSWCNSFHTYTCVRGASSIEVYWDGTLVRSVTPDDNGDPQSIMITMGVGNTGSSGAEILVDYVRVWTPG